MGSRKHNRAEAIKEARKSQALAKLRNCPTSPRKMRLVADQIRGVEVEKALFILKHSPKDASNKMEKLLLSALANWQTKKKCLLIQQKCLKEFSQLPRDVRIEFVSVRIT